ncbi:CSN-associated deubiquitinating enzyme Ubp12 [Rhizoclosmatium sp. JEL0117]|nr:CSN-associated deubiquitinating enzyme Ubp12 [Rhizoclosmatium sp. JEL0117]
MAILANIIHRDVDGRTKTPAVAVACIAHLKVFRVLTDPSVGLAWIPLDVRTKPMRIMEKVTCRKGLLGHKPTTKSMHTKGAIACAVSATRPNERRSIEYLQRKLKFDVEGGVLTIGLDYTSEPLDSISHIPPECRILRTVVSGTTPTDAYLHFHPTCWLRCTFASTNDVVDLPISQFTTICHLLDALDALVLSTWPLTPLSDNTSKTNMNKPRIASFECPSIDSERIDVSDYPGSALMFEMLGLPEESVSTTASSPPEAIDITLVFKTSTDIEPASLSEPAKDPPHRSNSNVSSVSTLMDTPAVSEVVLTPPPLSPPLIPPRRTYAKVYSPKPLTRNNSPSHEPKASPPSNSISKQLQRYPHGIAGLNNLGNTCYMNSALQCLIQTPPLVAYFLTLAHKSPEDAVDALFTELYQHSPPPPKLNAEEERVVLQFRSDLNSKNPFGSQGYLTTAFARLVRLVWLTKAEDQDSRWFEGMKRSGSSSSTLASDAAGNFTVSTSETVVDRVSDWKSFGPKVLKGAMAKFNDTFVGYEQQDSQEFLQVLLDGLHEDLKPVAPPSVDSLSISEQSTTEPSPTLSSPIAKIVQGTLKSHIECTKCQTVSSKRDPYTLLSLPISNGRDGPCKPPPVSSTILVRKLLDKGHVILNLKVESDWSILEVKKHVAERCGFSEKTQQNLKELVVVYWASQNRMKRVFADWESGIEACGDPWDDRWPNDGVVVCELAGKESDVHECEMTSIPVLFGCKKLFGIPTWIQVPASIPFAPRLPRLLDHCDQRVMHDILWVLERRRMGFFLYKHIVNYLAMSGFVRFPLFRKKSDTELDGHRIIEMLAESDWRSNLKILTDTCQSTCDDDCEIIPGLFDVEIRKGKSVATASEKIEFLERGCFGNDVEDSTIYPCQYEVPGIPVYPDDYKLRKELGEAYTLPAKKFTFPWKNLQDVRFPKPKSFIGDCSFDGELVVLLEFHPTIKSLLFREDSFRPYYDPSLDESPTDLPTTSNDFAVPPSYTLDNCMQEFLKEELMSVNDLWHCTTCKTPQQIKKKLSIEESPEILIFHLKRFASSASGQGFQSSSSRKIDVVVDFPITGFNMGHFMKNQQAIYDLYAVSSHIGGLGGGHYTAVVKSIEDGLWYEMDDNHATRIDETEIVTSAAYILFYRRRNCSDGEDEHRAFWETWCKLVKYHELSNAKRAEEWAPATKSIIVEPDSVSTSSSAPSVQSCLLLNEALTPAKRVKIVSDGDEIVSIRSGCSTSSAVSGTCSPFEFVSGDGEVTVASSMDSISVISVTGNSDTVMSDRTDKFVMVDSGLENVAVMLSPRGSVGKRTREPTDSAS